MDPNITTRSKRFSSTEIREMLCECESDHDEFTPSDNDEYIPPANDAASEVSDAEQVGCIEAAEDSYDSDDSVEEESNNELCGKDGTLWNLAPCTESQPINRNILRQRSGATFGSNILTAQQIFKSFLSTEICDIILRETNRKGKKIIDDYNLNMTQRFPNVADRPKPKIFQPFTEEELDAFFGILIFCGVHKSNKEHLSELWKPIHLPLIRAAMSLDRFRMMLRFIRFDSDATRTSRAATDKAAAIRDIWVMFNDNLRRNYKPGECITVDEQLYGYRGRTRFTQYMPSKPEKYGIKIFWACDASNSYPLHGQLYTGKPTEGERQTNIGERIVLDLVCPYKNSGRNITTDNFFTSLQLARKLNSWNLTLVGTVRKNKKFLPANMRPHKERQINSTNFAFRKEATLCSYVPKKKKAVVMLSTMHTKPVTESTTAAKPEIITYYNRTKGGVDNMDKLLGEYTSKRRTCRWPLALFFNIIDVAALAAYIVYMEYNAQFISTDRRRLFLKDLSFELCKNNIEQRAKNSNVTKSDSTRSAIQVVLGRDISTTAVANVENRDKNGRIAVVGSCYLCSKLTKKQRKTRKACKNCFKPICNEHSINRPICNNCLD